MTLSRSSALTAIEALVIDANTLISGQLSISSQLQAGEYWTVPEVLAVEVRDAATRLRIAPLLSMIQTRAPDAESLRLVSQFAKKTGDLAVLSAVDLRILALTLTLERERCGSIDHLRKEPVPVQTMCGGLSEKTHGARTAPALESRPKTDEPSEHKHESSESDGEWITPDNIKLRQSWSALETTSKSIANSMQVACTTSDFAMQNVLLQMGLKLISPAGARITMLKHWVLRCHACYRTTQDASKRFCPSCGGATLIRTSVSVDSSTGEMRLHLKRHFQYNNRGTVYPIPKPQGGKLSCRLEKGDMILREDQKEFVRGMKSYERSLRKANTDPDALPFHLMSASVRDHASQQSYFALPVVGHGKRNPNQVRRSKI